MSHDRVSSSRGGGPFRSLVSGSARLQLRAELSKEEMYEELCVPSEEEYFNEEIGMSPWAKPTLNRLLMQMLSTVSVPAP